jgi:RND family efflux transporter MFP subunit
MPTRGGVERTLTRPCSIHSFEYADLYAKVEGYLQNQSVDIGEKVRKDQLLAEIYSPELQKKAEEAAADLEKARALLTTKKAAKLAAEADLNEAKTKLESDKSQVEAAVAKVQLRKTQYKRIKALVEQKALEQELADEKMEAQVSAEAEEQVARKTLETDRSAIQAAAAKLSVAEAEIVNAQAGISVAQASLARAKVFVEYTHIRAPFDGVITMRTFHNGDFIEAAHGAGNKPLFTIARVDLMRVVVDVPDPLVPFVKPGERVEVMVDALPGKPIDGTVARMATSEEYQSRTMRTECDLPNSKGLLVNGMFGAMTLHLGKTEKNLSIPSACFAGTGKNDTRPVFVVQNGKAHRIEVQIGMDDGIRAEVLSGLKPEDQVVQDHGPGLAEGAPVKVSSKK